MADVRACVRCRAAPGVVHVREAVYCAECYKRVFAEKARASFELVRGAVLLQSVVEPHTHHTRDAPPPAFAVAFSGGTASSVLLHAVAQSFQSHGQPYVPARAPEFARIDVLYVDDGHMPLDAARARAAELAPNAHFVPLSLGSVFAPGQVSCTLLPRGGPRWLAPTAAACDDPDAALAALLGAVFPDTTPRTGVAAARTRAEDLSTLFLHRTLLAAAQERGCAALLYGDGAARTAARLLEGLAKGAGHKLPIETAASQWWCAERDVLVVHPLRAHLPNELAYYARAHGFGEPEDEQKDWSYEANADKSSMGRLTQSLIDSLQHGVSSTVSTVAGTGAKLVYQPERVWATEGAAAEAHDTSAVPLRRAETVPDARDAPAFPRIGAKGEGLVRAALAADRYDPRTETHVCPLCTYPAQRGAAEWRASHSATTLEEVPASPTADARLDLRGRLCYSCIQVLDVPEPAANAPQPSAVEVALPRYVLEAAVAPRVRGARATRTVEADADDGPDPSTEPHVPGGRTSHAPVPVSREAMRASVASYLL
ncbi:hypothetical protein CBS9595_000968 [Malassezia furfur]|nr:hypothetical protein CBS9595_000968 [Malassezia furfur]